MRFLDALIFTLVSLAGSLIAHASPIDPSRSLSVQTQPQKTKACEQALLTRSPETHSEFAKLPSPWQQEFEILKSITNHRNDPSQSSSKKYEMFFVESQLQQLERRLLRWEMTSFITSNLQFLRNRKSLLWFKRQRLLDDLSEKEWLLGQRLVSEEVRLALQTPAQELLQILDPSLEAKDIQCFTTRAPFYYHDGRLDQVLPLIRQSENDRTDFKVYPTLFLLDCQIQKMTPQGLRVDFPAMILQGLWREDAQLMIFGGKLLRID